MYGRVLETYQDELKAFDPSNTGGSVPARQAAPRRLVTNLVKVRMAEIEGAGEASASLDTSCP
jgi:hypothetical protein